VQYSQAVRRRFGRAIDSRIGGLEFRRGFLTLSAVKTLFEFRTFYRDVEVFNLP